MAAPLVVVAAGRVPNTDQLGLVAAGVTVTPDGRIEVGEDMRAERAQSGERSGDDDAVIAAIGDVVGLMRAHKASAQGRSPRRR